MDNSPCAGYNTVLLRGGRWYFQSRFLDGHHPDCAGGGTNYLADAQGKKIISV